MKQKSKRRGMSPKDRRRALVTAAMPEVKKLAKKYGRTTIGNCVMKIAAVEKEKRKLDTLRKEVAALQRKLA